MCLTQGSCYTDPGRCYMVPWSCYTDPGSCSRDPRSCCTDPGSCHTDPGSCYTDPGSCYTNNFRAQNLCTKSHTYLFECYLNLNDSIITKFCKGHSCKYCWRLMEAELFVTFNGTPGNIQGNFDRYALQCIFNGDALIINHKIVFRVFCFQKSVQLSHRMS